MTTTSSDPTTGRGFPFGKLVLGIVAGFALTLAFGAGALLAYQGQYADRIYPGVTVDGVDVAGLTRSAAAGRLATALGGYSQGTAVVTIDGTVFRIPYAALGRTADVDALVEQAWSVGRSPGDTVGRAVQGVRTFLDGTALDPAVAVDPTAVRDQVTALALAMNKAPVSGTVSVTKAGYVANPSSVGRVVPQDDVTAALIQRLSDPATPDTFSLTFSTAAVEPHVNDAEVAAALASANRMAKDVVVGYGSERWTIKASTVRSWISFAVTADGYAATVAPTAPTKALAQLATTFNRSAKEATFLVGRGSTTIVGVVAGRDGRTLNVAASAPVVAAVVGARAAASATTAPVMLAATVVHPKLTTEAARKVAPLMRKVSSWTTYYEVSERNGFGNNISIPARDLDGTVVAPGAVFDFWSSIGPVTYARGYRDGGAIINGHSQPTGALAGGICSTSTTLFNAVARAGYQTLSRHNHYYYISRYPTGMDATVAITGGAVTTMSWRNDSQYPVLIRSSARPGVVSFSLYTVASNGNASVGGGWAVPGSTNVTYHVANGRTVVISTSPKRNYSVATSSVQRTSALPKGAVKVVEYPDDGFDVTVTRSVYQGGKLLWSNVWVSHYARVNGLTLVGS